MARILYVTLAADIAGAEKSLLLLISHLQHTHRLTLVCPAGGGLAKKAIEMGCAWRELPASPTRSYRSPTWIANWLRLSGRVYDLARKDRAELIHANSIYAATVSLLAAWCTPAELVWHARDFSGPRPVLRLCGAISSRVIGVSRSIKEHLLNRGVPPSKVEVVYNGVEMRDRPLSPRCASGRSPHRADRKEGTTFANVGQFIPWKNQALFVDAAALVAREDPRSRFMLVGDDIFGRNPGYKRRLQERIAHLGLTDRVVFPGWYDDMTAVWEQIDCLVHTSGAEPFGRVIIEAMLFGVPVVSVDACGPSEIIQDGVNGLLVPPGDARFLSEAMLRIACDRDLASRLAGDAYDHVVRQFSAADTALRVGRVYTDILEQRSSACRRIA